MSKTELQSDLTEVPLEQTYRQRYAMQIEYVGSHFSGWQRQPSQRCVQSELEKALSSVANHKVEVVCAGRTDTGVHAIGQIVHFDTCAERELRGWLLGANTLLPDDVSIAWVKPVSAEFHARYSAVARTYRYFILNTLSRSALYAKRALWNYHTLDADKMHQAAQLFLGEQDFSSVRGADCQSKRPFRNVHRISVQRYSDWLVLEVTANAFLHHMVRNIVGSLLEVGRHKRPAEWIAEMLAQKDRKAAGVTAAAHGLYFVRAHYPEKFKLPEVSYSPVLHGLLSSETSL